jgi:hypothetical protein
MNESLLIGSIAGVFFIICVLFESVAIVFFNFAPLGRALWQAAQANVLSLGVIYLVWPLFSRMNIDEDKVFPLLPLLWIATVVTEALVLKFVNRSQPWRRVFLTSAAMNSASFAVLYLILSLL